MYSKRRVTDGANTMNASALESNKTRLAKSVLLFFLLAAVLMIPFWVFGAITRIDLLPGLPVAALGTFCPAVAAMLLVYREDNWGGVAALLKRSFDFGRIRDKRWYAPILLIMPIVALLAFWVLRLSGVAVPAPQFPIVPTLAFCVITFIAALGEELGWSGYALNPLQARWGAFRASIILGAYWAAYHYIALAQANRSMEWIAWWTLDTIAARVIMVWLFNNTGKSVFGVALFHMMLNVTWQLFPVQGSYWDPRVTGLLLTAVAAIVVAVAGPQWGGAPSKP